MDLDITDTWITQAEYTYLLISMCDDIQKTLIVQLCLPQTSFLVPTLQSCTNSTHYVSALSYEQLQSQ